MPKVEILDNEEAIKQVDCGGMLSVVSQMPEMILQAEKLAAGISLPPAGKISQVLVLGMGGSAIAGDIAADIFFKKAKVPILTVRNYVFPEYVGPETLFFALSYSGDTEEVLIAAASAEKCGAKIICVTSGGKLKGIAEKKKYPLFILPTGYQPRAALPYLLLPLIISLDKLGIAPLPAEDIRETAAVLRELREEIGSARPCRVNPAKQLAKKLAGQIPFIFGSAGTTAAAALRFKTQLNENSKMTAIVNLFPELNHNELVNLSALKRAGHSFAMVILRDEEDGERVKKRIEITRSLISRQVGGINEILSRGKSRLARIASLIFYGDHVSVYLALLEGIDPTAVEMISRFKKEMSR